MASGLKIIFADVMTWFCNDGVFVQRIIIVMSAQGD